MYKKRFFPKIQIPAATSSPATMLNCEPEITRMCVVPLRMKASCSSWVILPLMPRIMPCASEACGSGSVAAIACDNRFLNA